MNARSLLTIGFCLVFEAGLSEENISELDPSDAEWFTYTYDWIMFNE